jgi:signal transduction histidine kinase
MASLSELLQQQHEQIMTEWAAKAHQAASARGLDQPELRNILPRFLSALADGADPAELVEHHLSDRLRKGFELAEIVEEFVLLERCITSRWLAMPVPDRPSEEDRLAFGEQLQRAIVSVTNLFHEHMQRDEQWEKRYLRLLQTLADDALRSPDAPLRSNLRGVLELLLEATRAHSISLVLFEPDSGEVLTSASAGDAKDELRTFAVSLDASSLIGTVAASAEPTRIADVHTTDLEVSDTLRHSGIHSILGVRLPPGRRLAAVLYIGLREKRSFTAREVARLETLGAGLTLHLDNAKLFADLRDRIRELGIERDLRERFVAILAHDLRGPLSAAKMSSHLLIRYPERLDERRDLAVRVERNLDRIDRMISDLLDVSRVRAGQRLPLRLDECDLGALAEQVVEELSATHGDRFELVRSETVRGIWSQGELHRALWNLGTNAVKYGAPDAPITVRVERTPTGARLSVHNLGKPIASEDQAGLFDLYSRLKDAARPGSGWGLGLALVRACAEAHGGQVEVQSNQQDGTTFTLELPHDSRPFQPSPAEAQ